MNKFFGQDTPFFNMMDKLGNIICVTLLWIIGCIPLVTVGTSSIAMYYTTVKAIRHGEGYVTREFFSAYKSNLKSGIVMTLVFLVLGVVLVIERIYVGGIQSQVSALMSAGYALIILIMAGLQVYIWPVMSRFNMGNASVFRCLCYSGIFRPLLYSLQCGYWLWHCYLCR